MGKYYKRYLTVEKKDYDHAHDILTKFYDRGDVDAITVTDNPGDKCVLIGVECSSDDYLLIIEELEI